MIKNIVQPAIATTFIAPAINFDAQTGICELIGDSYLEATPEFYEPLLVWLKTYMTQVNKPITFNFKVKYFNTSTSGFFLDILLLLKDYQDKGGDVSVFWYLKDEDPDLEEEIEDYMQDTNLHIQVLRKSY